MGKIHYTLIFKHLLVLCLSIALIQTQAGKLHMHLVHDSHSGSSVHVVGVHLESTQHDVELTHHHENISDGPSKDHSDEAVDVSPDILLKNSKFLSALVGIIFFIGLLLYTPRRMSLAWQRRKNFILPPCYYLFQPPLRAPPLMSL